MGRSTGEAMPKAAGPSRVATLSFATPTAAAARQLQDLLNEYGATVRPGLGEGWLVEVPLLSKPHELGPAALAVARQGLPLSDLKTIGVRIHDQRHAIAVTAGTSRPSPCPWAE